ncbi:MAG: molybdenum ABC transporter ATP-binding protein [Deltaproteobacteria bacterium]|nr:molybdenum ABC transporter ATP-binding protein [Deltaproteobacteria bacterium]
MKITCRIPLAEFELNINASFEARLTSIFGPSGSGKTTLLDAIAGLRAISSGEIEIGGKTLYSSARGINLAPQQRGIGYVPQEAALFPHLSVWNNILFGSVRKDSVNDAKGMTLEHVTEVLEIGSLLERPVAKLSGGEAQRVALARAILSRPRLLLLDEPLAALDVGLKERILPYLARVRDEFAIPMIYVTHNLTEVLTLADWVLMIQRGQLLAQGAPKEVLRSSLSVAQAADDDFDNVLTVAFVDSDKASGRARVRTPSGQELFIPYMERPTIQALQVRISADDILLGTQKPEGISAGNIVAGVIQRVEALDGEVVITVLAGEEFYVRLTGSAVTRLGLAEQSPVFLIMKTRSFHLL